MNVHSASLKGLRNQNEDNHEIILNRDGKNPNLNSVDFFAVYDGHGGKQVSNYLKNNLSKYFMDKRVKYPLTKKYVNNVYDAIQTSLKQESWAQHTGSTALVVIRFNCINSDYINVINLGDCRAVLCRDQFAIPLTIDAKPSTPSEYHRINKLGGKISFDGFDWRIKDLSLSRSFGDTDAAPFVTHRPELYRYKLDKTDKFIVIGCDGLYDVLSNSQIIDYILMNTYDQNMHRRKTTINMAKKIAEYAISKGSTDNVSSILVFLN